MPRPKTTSALPAKASRPASRRTVTGNASCPAGCLAGCPRGPSSKASCLLVSKTCLSKEITGRRLAATCKSSKEVKQDRWGWCPESCLITPAVLAHLFWKAPSLHASQVETDLFIRTVSRSTEPGIVSQPGQPQWKSECPHGMLDRQFLISGGW